MHILLININPVVSRLISFCMREDNIDLEELENVGAVARDSYDVVFVDEASYGDETEEVLENLIIRKKVFLSSGDDVSDEAEFFDSIIKKPFLPSQITAVLESLEEDDTLEVVTETP
jgi:DNA-binding response OmpR family regulator